MKKYFQIFLIEEVFFMKVGLPGFGLIGWHGGIDLIKKYLNVMRNYDEIKVCLFLPSFQKEVEELENMFVSEYPEIEIAMHSDNIIEMIKLMESKKIDILFPCHAPLGENFPITWIGYIPDIQHKRLPQNFSFDEIRQRDFTFQRQLRECDSLIVTSKDVKNDILKYYPPDFYDEKKIFATEFSPILREEWLHLENISLKKYKLPEKYFIISNQFWIHKDHKTAFRALALLHKNYSSFKNVHIVCTGKMEDYRDPNHIKNLKAEIRKLKLENKIHLLGFIPRLDQIKMIRNSVAVIQPSVFEGDAGGGGMCRRNISRKARNSFRYSC